MKKPQLQKEYFKVMDEAARASSRRETIDLYKKARSIKKMLCGEESDFSLTGIDHSALRMK